MSTADQILYPYQVTTAESLSVNAYAWLRNNGIDYQINFDTNIEDPLYWQYSVIRFARQQDAIWFRLRWA